MSKTNDPSNIENKDELIIKRMLNAPIELVWEVHSQPEHLKNWWGPKGFKMKVIQMDFSPGGLLFYSLENSQGFKMWGKVFYNEILKPVKMVYINGFSNENGELTRHPLSDTWPLEIHNTFILTPQEDQTLLTLKSRPINASNEEIQTYIGGFESVKAGFAGAFEQLDSYLSKLQD